MGFLKEFKEFAVKGNVVDMAVGVVIGSAFGKIVSSLVADVVMPLISVVMGKVNLATLSWVIGEPGAEDAITVAYGNFLQTVLDFFIIALSIFIVVRMINKAKKKFEKPAEPAPEPAPPAPSKEELLLTEIRDLLKEKNA